MPNPREDARTSMVRLKFIRIRTMHRLVLDNCCTRGYLTNGTLDLDCLQEVRNRAYKRTLRFFFFSSSSSLKHGKARENGVAPLM